MKISLTVLLCALVPALPETAAAQSYPAKPIRLVFPAAAGASSNGLLSRALADRLSDTLGQRVLIDNRPGANGNIGSAMVARSAPDGYTLLVGYTSSLATGPSAYVDIGYDPVGDLAPIARFAMVPYVIVVNPAVPATSLRELIALAKSKPGQLNYASAGNGGLPHLCSELFKVAAGINAVHVPFKDGANAVIGLIGGDVQMYCTGITSVISAIKSGQLRAIATTTLDRSPMLPNTPTAHESGLADFDVGSWVGIFAPAKTPAPIVNRLHNEIVRVVNEPEMTKFLESQGAEPALMGPAQFAASLKAEIAKWMKVAKAANLKPEYLQQK